MSKLSFVILSIVSSSLALHLLLLPFSIAQEDTTAADIVARLTGNNSSDSVEVVHFDAQKIFEFERMEPMDMMGMGISDARCDNGRVNLATDFDPHDSEEVERHTKCLENNLWMGRAATRPLLTIMKRPLDYVSIHKCMMMKIKYLQPIPNIGPHRPLWAEYGEYQYCPPQRWLHNVEHGGIVALYHPCAVPEQVEQLKRLVKRCLFRHVITPYLNLTLDRPLALVGWSATLEMPLFDFNMIRNFIKLYALTGPEKVFRDGQYGQLLVERAEYVTDVIDSEVCPGM